MKANSELFHSSLSSFSGSGAGFRRIGKPGPTMDSEDFVEESDCAAPSEAVTSSKAIQVCLTSWCPAFLRTMNSELQSGVLDFEFHIGVSLA